MIQLSKIERLDAGHRLPVVWVWELGVLEQRFQLRALLPGAYFPHAFVRIKNVNKIMNIKLFVKLIFITVVSIGVIPANGQNKKATDIKPLLDVYNVSWDTPGPT